MSIRKILLITILDAQMLAMAETDDICADADRLEQRIRGRLRILIQHFQWRATLAQKVENCLLV